MFHSPLQLAEMSEVHIVDLDDALISWAMDKLGSDYTVEKVDASKVSTIV